MSASSCFGIPLRVGSHPTTVALLTVMVTLAVAAALGARQALCLIWNHTFMTQFYFWNVLTGSLLETHPLKLVLSLAGVLGMGPAVEESLGHVGMAVFLVVVSLASGLITSTGIFVAYIVTRLEYLLDLEIHGTFGLMAALAVAAAQHDPKSSFLADGRAPWFPMRYFPLVLVTASATARALSLPLMSQDFPFVVVGAYSAWVYLRFFAHIVVGGPSGDISDEFRLVMFFPPMLHCVVKPVGDFTYGVFLLLGFFQGREARVPPSAVDGHGGVDPSTAAILPPPERKDPIAERRRARAMKLLDEKFAKLNAKPANRWDDDEPWEAKQSGAGAEKKTPGIGLGVIKLATPKLQAKKSAPSRLPSEGDVDEDDWGMADVEGEAEAAVVDEETGGGGGSGATGENKSPESSR
ncbi:unnamed protein product [Ascophyllum nodosum]